MDDLADVIVVGGGVVGLWTAYHLSVQKKKTILLEQFPYPHSRGSSHGQSRIIRTAYCDEEYAAMMPESYRQWRKLERETGKSLFLRAGLVTMFKMDDPDEVQAFNRMRSNLEKYASCEVINGIDLASRFTGLFVTPEYSVLYDEEAGVLMADKCLLALRELFVKHGGILHEHERVLSIRYISETKVEVVSSERVYQCKSVIITAGAYTNGILSTTGIELPLTVKKAPVLYWRDKSSTQKYSLKNGFPTTSMHLANDYYSIPSYEYPGMMKICHEALISVDPTRRNALSTKERKKEEERVDRLKKTIKINFPDIDASAPVIQENCVITRTPDWRFIIDRHPKFRNIIIGTGFSAHGFKTAPTVGGMLANLATGLEPSYPLKPFSIDRFKKSKL